MSKPANRKEPREVRVGFGVQHVHHAPTKEAHRGQGAAFGRNAGAQSLGDAAGRRDRQDGLHVAQVGGKEAQQAAFAHRCLQPRRLVEAQEATQLLQPPRMGKHVGEKHLTRKAYTPRHRRMGGEGFAGLFEQMAVPDARGQAGSQARQPRQRSSWCRKASSGTRRPSLTAFISAMRPRGDAASYPVS